jgi:penicillin-binding protein 1B
MITDMLSDVIDHGTARAARGAVKRTAIAGKTGTSRDGWFVGYTPNLVCVVWIGFDDNKQLGLTGAEAALPAWTEFVKGAVELRPELGGEAFERPAGIMTVEIDPETGMIATDACPQRERIAVTRSLAPHFECYTHSEMFPLVASTDGTGFDDSTVTITQGDGTRTVVIEGSTVTRRAPPPPSVITSVEALESPSSRATRVETVRGRSTLVNDVRSNTSVNEP